MSIAARSLSATVLLLAGWLPACGGPRPFQPAPPLAITDATLVDGRTGAATPHMTIVAEGGRIRSITPASEARVPEGARVLDGRGRWVTPGFIDVHVHESDPAYLKRLLAAGFTSIHLMPERPLRRPVLQAGWMQSPFCPTPRVLYSEMVTGGFPDNLMPGVYAFQMPRTVEQARRLVRDSHGRGYTSLKIIQDDSRLWAGDEQASPPLADEVLQALAEQARELDMRLYVHAVERDATRAALRAGVDAFLHGTMDAELTDDDWRAMRSGEVAWTPAHVALTWFGDRGRFARAVLADEHLMALLDEQELAALRSAAEVGGPSSPLAVLEERLDEYLATVAANTRLALQAGVPIAVGSDGGPPGVGAHLEMEHLSQAGLSPAQVLRAATFGGAQALGWSSRVGALQEGLAADLVVLTADPLLDVRNTRRIEWVVKGGVPVEPPQQTVTGP